MTLTMQLWFLLALSGGMVLGHLLGTHYNLGGNLIGFVAGFLSMDSIISFVFDYASRIFRPLPSCRKGGCNKRSDYCWWQARLDAEGKHRVGHYECRCGESYILIEEKITLFKELLPDGTTRPYLKLTAFRKWEPDEVDVSDATIYPGIDAKE